MWYTTDEDDPYHLSNEKELKYFPSYCNKIEFYEKYGSKYLPRVLYAVFFSFSWDYI